MSSQTRNRADAPDPSRQRAGSHPSPCRSKWAPPWSLLGIEPHGRAPTPHRRWLACTPQVRSNSARLSWSRLREASKRGLNNPEATRLPPTCSPTWRRHSRYSAPPGTNSLPTPLPRSRNAAGASHEAPHGRRSTDSLASKKYISWEHCTTSPRRSPPARAPVERDDRRSHRLSRGAPPDELTIRAAVTTSRGPRRVNLQSSMSRDRLVNPSARVSAPELASAP